MQENYGSVFLYFLVYGVSILISNYYQKRYYTNNKILWRVLIILLPTLMTGFRSIYYCGKWSDTYNDYVSFMQCGSDIKGLLKTTNSKFFTIIKYIIFHISNGNVTAYFTIVAFFTLYFLVISIENKKSESNLALCLFLFYTFLGLRMLDQMRQLLAVTILSYSLCMLELNKVKKSIFYSIIASLIHITALPIYLFCYIYSRCSILNRKKYITISLCIMIAVFMRTIINSISRINLYGSYSMYFNDRVINANIGLGLVLDYIPLLFLIVYFLKKKSKKHERVSLNLMYLFFLFRYMGYFSYFIMRMCYYSYNEGIIYFSGKYQNLKYKSNKIILRICITIIMTSYFLLYFYVSMGNQGMYFPYIPFWKQ